MSAMRLYVGNVPYEATEAQLEEWFAAEGFAVDSVTLMRDKMTGQARGFGFVEIYDDSNAEKAIQACNGKEFMGRSLVVNEARPRTFSGGGRGSAPRGPARRRPRW